MSVLIYENSIDSIPADKVLMKTLLDLQKRFLKNHVCPQMLGGPFLRLGIPKERLRIPPGSGWGGKDTGWLATWACPLRTDSASWNSFESLIQLISFCSSWILPVSSRIVSWSAINFSPRNCLECWALKSLQFFRLTETFLMSFTKIPILCQQLFMKKLLISSKLFVSLMSTINFSSLRLDHCFQFSNTFSVVLGLEFVFSNLCLTVSENLLSLSLQESPNLFTFRVVSLSFLGARNLWTKWANNGSPRSIMTDWRRQTGRLAFFFRVIGSSSARVKECLADGDVIVVEVIREPLLASGLLGVFDLSLCDEVVVGLITCGRLVLGQGAKVLSGSAQRICPPHRGSWRCRAVGTAEWSERWWRRKESEWRSKRSGTALTTRWHMRVQHGMNANLSLVGPWANAVWSTSRKKQSRDADN